MLFKGVVILFMIVSLSMAVPIGDPPKPETIEVLISSAKPEMDSRPPSTVVPIISSVAPEAPEPVSVEPTPPTPPPRRLVSYDQRQDGRVNIRADLENFVIMIIPSAPQGTASLLDLLSRTQGRVKKVHGKKPTHLKKFHEKVDDSPKNTEVDHIANQRDHYVGSQVPSEYIEGRTPYHVDLTALEQHMMPHESRVEYIKPTYLARSPYYRQLQPATVEISESLTPPIVSHINPSNVEYRNRRSLKVSSKADDPTSVNKNSLILTTDLNNGGDLSEKVTVDDKDDDVQTSIDSSNGNDSNTGRDYYLLSDTINSFDSLNIGNLDLMDSASPDANKWDQWSLLSDDAVENCGPGRRRDSYGICRAVPDDLLNL